MNDQDDERARLVSKLNGETSKIAWTELQRFYASGSVIELSKKMDLIQVACEFSLDNKEAVQAWLADNSVCRVEDARAADLLQQETELWAVVVAPWVLVQEIKD